jgi:regulatory protein
MEQPGFKKTLIPQQAKVKAEAWCAYQERAQQEVRNKLYQWGLKSTDVEEIIAGLIETNFLNEERFARAYAQGKSRMKGWGKAKIKAGLKQKAISERLISKALQQVEGDDYEERLKTLLEKKSALLTEKDPYKRRYKLSNYALSKGYDYELINKTLSAMTEG